eukprot:TRINITY_DN44159_c0_g1_i1.p1 TRINITY_DN44159_c0_g1~~TRINITY_DN44159_c0_g1_i1.p1  ORF type:complete len:287 (+),score=54.07 TRINITY_DN44159_c0_g1_i1:70-930(+)
MRFFGFHPFDKSRFAMRSIVLLVAAFGSCYVACCERLGDVTDTLSTELPPLNVTKLGKSAGSETAATAQLSSIKSMYIQAARKIGDAMEQVVESGKHLDKAAESRAVRDAQRVQILKLQKKIQESEIARRRAEVLRESVERIAEEAESRARASCIHTEAKGLTMDGRPRDFEKSLDLLSMDIASLSSKLEGQQQQSSAKEVALLTVESSAGLKSAVAAKSGTPSSGLTKAISTRPDGPRTESPAPAIPLASWQVVTAPAPVPDLSLGGVGPSSAAEKAAEDAFWDS